MLFFISWPLGKTYSTDGKAGYNRVMSCTCNIRILSLQLGLSSDFSEYQFYQSVTLGFIYTLKEGNKNIVTMTTIKKGGILAKQDYKIYFDNLTMEMTQLKTTRRESKQYQ